MLHITGKQKLIVEKLNGVSSGIFVKFAKISKNKIKNEHFWQINLQFISIYLQAEMGKKIILNLSTINMLKKEKKKLKTWKYFFNHRIK